MIYGNSGSGKTSLLCRCATVARAKAPEAIICIRFIGTTASSSTLQSLLHAVCSQLAVVYKDKAARYLTQMSLPGRGPFGLNVGPFGTVWDHVKPFQIISEVFRIFFGSF